MTKPTFDWDEAKDAANQQKHGVSFEEAELAFLDPQRVIHRHLAHSRPDGSDSFALAALVPIF